MKSETEKAMWKWMREEERGFVMNSIVSDQNLALETRLM